MAGFVDVVLRGLILVLTSVALGGVAWLRFVLRAEAHVKPDAPTALALRAIAVAALGAAVAQAAIVLVGLGALADAHGAWPVGAFLDTTFALTAIGRVGATLGARRALGPRYHHPPLLHAGVLVDGRDRSRGCCPQRRVRRRPRRAGRDGLWRHGREQGRAARAGARAGVRQHPCGT